MTHFSRLYTAVIDVPPADRDRELAFWRSATGEELAQTQFAGFHGSQLHSQEFALLVQRIDDGQARVHLDIHTDDLEAEVTRLEKLGAERVEQVNAWCVLRDPAGLLFCVVPEEPGSLTEHNAKRWD
jgi:hypothetical protein